MKITLRKANAVQNSINDLLKSVDLNVKIAINEFQNGEVEVARGNVELYDSLNRKTRLLSALCEIRKSVGRANSTAGINDKLADIADLEKRIQIYAPLLTSAVRETSVVLEGKLDRLRNRKDDARMSIYGREDVVETSVLSEQDIALFKGNHNSVKKEKQRLQDEVLELNVRTEITLSEDVVATLTAEGLI